MKRGFPKVRGRVLRARACIFPDDVRMDTDAVPRRDDIAKKAVERVRAGAPDAHTHTQASGSRSVATAW